MGLLDEDFTASREATNAIVRKRFAILRTIFGKV